MSTAVELTYRPGKAADLEASFALGHRAYHHTIGESLTDAALDREWQLSRELVEFVAAQEGCYWICEQAGETVGYARMCRFGEMEELTQLAVVPSHRRQGIARELLTRCWPDDPRPDLGRVVVAPGAPSDLTLFTEFGVMPVVGHWHMRARAEEYTEHRSQEIDVAEPPVVALSADHAVNEWKRLEPPAIGHRRPLLHEFFGRTRTCLATLDGDHATALCWIGPRGEIGPAVGADARGPGAGGASGPGPRGEEQGARRPADLLLHRQLVAAAPPAQPRVPARLAEPGDVQHPAAGTGQVPAHPALAASLARRATL